MLSFLLEKSKFWQTSPCVLRSVYSGVSRLDLHNGSERYVRVVVDMLICNEVEGMWKIGGRKRLFRGGG